MVRDGMTLIVATTEESKATELDDCQRLSSYRLSSDSRISL